ncbi:MAG: sulfatase-like hydrolase/transferase [Bacteroidales bacterium]|jgi:heptose-I-phosphate ethanolaminephosphotransferase|nr:sulfatase-like hydrolase/transferase [Bacteroidales bacterium]
MKQTYKKPCIYDIKRACIILLITFFCPAFYFWDNGLGVEEITTILATAVVTAISLYYITGFAPPKARKIILAILFVLSIPGNIIVWSNLYVSHQWMKVSSFWVIFSTNPTEAGEYIKQFTDIINITVSVLYTITGTVLIAAMKSTVRTTFRPLMNKILFLPAFAAIVMTMILNYIVIAVPTFGFYHSFARFAVYNNKMKQMLNLKDNMQDVPCSLQSNIPHTFVIVIGESTSKYHQSIYGYQRNTTPYQDTLKNNGELLIYTNIVTPHMNTRDALEKVLSFANCEKPKEMLTKPNIIDIVNAAILSGGKRFTSYWINNQELKSIFQSPVCFVCSKNAGNLIDIKSANDGPVLEAFRNTLSDTAENKIIFLHLAGNHFKYSNRYTSEFDKFDYREDGLIDRDFRTNNMKKTIDQYDNSILFGDYILHSVIEAVRSINHSSFVLFFSDHGEDVYEDGNFLGHHSEFYPTRYQSEVPFVIWRSKEYISEIPELNIDTARPYNNEDFIHSLGILMRLKYPAFDSTLSIF